MKKWFTPKRIFVGVLAFVAWVIVSIVAIYGALFYLLYRGMYQ